MEANGVIVTLCPGWTWRKRNVGLPDSIFPTPEGIMTLAVQEWIPSPEGYIGFRTRQFRGIESVTFRHVICLLHTCELIHATRDPEIPVSLHFSNVRLPMTHDDLPDRVYRPQYEIAPGLIGWGAISVIQQPAKIMALG